MEFITLALDLLSQEIFAFIYVVVDALLDIGASPQENGWVTIIVDEQTSLRFSIAPGSVADDFPVSRSISVDSARLSYSSPS